MSDSIPISGKANAAFFAGLAAVLCGLFVLILRLDLLLLGIALFTVVALILGVSSLAEINESCGQLADRKLAYWGMGLPIAGLVAGFLLLPAT